MLSVSYRIAAAHNNRKRITYAPRCLRWRKRNADPEILQPGMEREENKVGDVRQEESDKQSKGAQRNSPIPFSFKTVGRGAVEETSKKWEDTL